MDDFQCSQLAAEYAFETGCQHMAGREIQGESRHKQCLISAVGPEMRPETSI